MNFLRLQWGGGGGFQLTDTKNSSKFTSQVRTAFLKEINCLGKKLCIYFCFFVFYFFLLWQWLPITNRERVRVTFSWGEGGRGGDAFWDGAVIFFILVPFDKAIWLILKFLNIWPWPLWPLTCIWKILMQFCWWFHFSGSRYLDPWVSCSKRG